MTLPDAPGAVALGPLSCTLADEGLRWLCLGGVETVRGVSFPIRDASWGTHPLRVAGRRITRGDGALGFAAALETEDGAFAVDFAVELAAGDAAARADLSVTIRALREGLVNRAGFALLHPIAGVAGQPMTVTRPDGRREEVVLPARISPGQPVRDIAGLAHRVGPVAVEIAMEGDVFEMEDQRNWSDASFKTYCRPLALPRPFRLAAGETITQRIAIRLRAAPGAVPGAPRPTAGRGRMPEIALAVEAGLSSPAAPAALAGLRRIARLRADAATADLAALAGGTGPLTLEIVVPEGTADPAVALASLAGRATAAGLAPDRTVALPAAYLASHQPEGPWPGGPAPGDLVAPLRAAFPGVAAGTGVLTNFTELNRCPPRPGADFVTFAGTAIVHAADDASVMETLQAWPDICASARALAGPAPLHLGLVAIGMRSNPYGADVAANPGRTRLAMAREDPRQETAFAAAWAAGLLAALAEGGVASVALAMPDGALGAAGPAGARPILHLMRHAARLAGAEVAIRREGPLVVLSAAAGGMAANLGPAPVAHGIAAGRLLADPADPESRDPFRTDRPPGPLPPLLPPFAAILFDGVAP